jgi:hypothetical protein
VHFENQKKTTGNKAIGYEAKTIQNSPADNNKKTAVIPGLNPAKAGGRSPNLAPLSLNWLNIQLEKDI